MNLRNFLLSLIIIESAMLVTFLAWPWIGKWGATLGLTLLFLLGC